MEVPYLNCWHIDVKEVADWIIDMDFGDCSIEDVNKKTITAISNIVTAISDIYRPIKIVCQCYSTEKIPEPFTITNKKQIPAEEFAHKAREYLSKITKEHGAELLLDHIRFHGDSNIHMFDEETKKIVRRWYPGNDFDRERLNWFSEVLMDHGTMSDENMYGVITMDFGGCAIIGKIEGERVKGCKTYISIATKSDIWLDETLFAQSGDKGFINAKLGKLNREVLFDLLRRVEKASGGEISSFESEWGSFMDRIYKYGLL